MGLTSTSRSRKGEGKTPASIASNSIVSTPKKAKQAAAAVVTPDVAACKPLRRKKSTKKKTKTSAAAAPHSCQNSTLFAVFPTYKGRSVNRQTIVELWEMQKQKLCNNESLTQFQDRIPEIVEFCLMLWQRQQMQQKMNQATIDVLQRYHFCNNYRELDRGTAYFRSQVLTLVEELFGEKQSDTVSISAKIFSYDKQPLPTRLEYTTQVLAMSYYYRLCNKIESFQDPHNPVGGIPRLGQFDAAFVKYVQTYNSSTAIRTFFTCAHLNQGFKKYIEGCQQSTAKIPKIALQIFEATNSGDGKIDRKTICKHLKTLDGVGSFTAWQILCDLEESSCFGPCNQVCSSIKTDDFVELGPGAKKGLIKIFGESDAKRGDFQSLAILLRDNFHDLLRLVNKEFPLWKHRPVNLKVIEHALCEFQKFVQIQEGKTAGQRVFHSRSVAMDLRLQKQCPSCNSKGTRMVRCDTCHFIACETCQKAEFHSIKPSSGQYGYTCCRRCHSLDQLDLR